MTARCVAEVVASPDRVHPSMEGRSRDRPMDSLRIGRHRSFNPSMEGRSRDRPMKQRETMRPVDHRPSMEGRSRDRPMSHLRSHTALLPCFLQWRGGHVTARW